MKELAVVALGGNALVKKGEEELEKQEVAARQAIISLLPLYKKYNLIITHGNGPQVGNLLLRSELAKGKAYHVPLDYCVAQSQGETGYLLSGAIDNVFPKAEVITILTRVSVSEKDPAFRHPTKPVGDFYSIHKVADWKRHNVSFIYDAGRGYRRVVPSPYPLSIKEAPAILHLAKTGHIIIAVGGGGIPVTSKAGVEAVIDKDLASAVLAKEVRAEILVILTAVDAVYLNYLSSAKKPLRHLTVRDCKKYLAQRQFPAGSMGPKIEAAMYFLGHGGRKVIITDHAHLHMALQNRAGTEVKP